MSPLGFVSAAASIGLESILVKPKRGIGSFTAQVTLEESHDDDLEITEHPVEQGANIADHAFKRAARLRIRCAWSNSPSNPSLIGGIVGGLAATASSIQSALSGSSASSVRDTYAKLLKLQAQREPFEVFTGKRAYKDMLIRSLSVTTDKESENTLAVTATFQQVIMATTQTTAVSAPADSQADPSATQGTSNAGSKTLEPTNKFNSLGAGRGFPDPKVVR